jgi:uncharacterized RDD family membrane protein YckC
MIVIDERAVSRNTNISTKKTIQVAGFGRRLLTALYDGLIIAVAGFFLILVLGMLLVMLGLMDTGESQGFSILASISLVALSIIYYVTSWTASGQTLGKMIGGIKVISANGSPVSLGQALLRYLGYVVSAAVISVGFLWVAFDGKRQGWHDKIARTYIVDSDVTFSGDENLEFVPADPGSGWIWLAVWAVLLILAPGALFGSLWILAPLVIRAIASTLGIAGYGE